MWGMLLAITAMVLVLITTITLYLQQDRLKHELNKKLNKIIAIVLKVFFIIRRIPLPDLIRLYSS